MGGLDLGGQATDLRERGEVGQVEVRALVTRGGAQLADGRLAALAGAPVDQHARAAGGELVRCGATEPVGRAGDEDGSVLDRFHRPLLPATTRAHAARPEVTRAPLAESRLSGLMLLVRLSRSLALTVSAALLAAGCGGADQQIPTGSARALVADIDAVEQGVRAGECDRTGSRLQRLKRTAAELPEDVDAELRTTLEGGVVQLERLAKAECRQRKPEPVEEEPEPVAPPPVETTPEPEPEPEPAPEPEPEPEPAPEPEPEPEPAPEPEPEPEPEPPDEEPPGEDRPKKKRDKPDDTVRDPCPPGSAATC